MPFIRIWVHYVWATKERRPLLTAPFRSQLFAHIKTNAETKGIYLDRVNGYLDHVHCLVSLGSGQTVDKIVQLLKGEASFWANNKSGYGGAKIEWQDEYFAVSVGESTVNHLRTYIDRQEIHHKKKSFAEEYEELMTKYGFAILK